MDTKTTRPKLELLDAMELAALLRISLATVRTWTMRGQLPVVRLGRRVLFRRDRIERWLAAREEGADRTPRAQPER